MKCKIEERTIWMMTSWSDSPTLKDLQVFLVGFILLFLYQDNFT